MIERVVSYTPEFRSCNFSAEAKDLLQKVRRRSNFHRISHLDILALSKNCHKSPHIYSQDQKAHFLFYNVSPFYPIPSFYVILISEAEIGRL